MNNRTKINAIVLAGTHADKSKLIYNKNKALLEIHGEPIINRVLNALKKSNYISRIAVVGPRRELEQIIETDVKIIQESKAPKESRRFIENAIRGYNILSPNGEKTLFAPSDLPFISAECIENFILKCNNDAAFYFGIINVKNIPKWIEEFKKSARFHLKDKGSYRTANMVLAEGAKITDIELLESEIEKAFPKRRTNSLYSKFRLYGFIFKKYPVKTLKYLSGRLKEKDVESAFKKGLNLSFKFIETKDPRTAIDIDYKEEYEFIRANYQMIAEYISNQKNN